MDWEKEGSLCHRHSMLSLVMLSSTLKKSLNYTYEIWNRNHFKHCIYLISMLILYIIYIFNIKFRLINYC